LSIPPPTPDPLRTGTLIGWNLEKVLRLGFS